VYIRTNSTSPLAETIVGLHLLYLLVENRLADFHGQLELLSEDALKYPAVLFCTQLEQHLVVGAYDQVYVVFITNQCLRLGCYSLSYFTPVATGFSIGCQSPFG
jgi:hypothetical protein